MSEKLKVSDLRKGNTVQVTGGFEQRYFSEVVAIFDETIRLDNQKFESYNQAWCIVDYDIEEIFGIPLTSEILLACGYSDCAFRENHFVIKGHSIWKCNEMFLCDKNGVILKTLHQLQNLYFALTNQELEFKTELK